MTDEQTPAEDVAFEGAEDFGDASQEIAALQLAAKLAGGSLWAWALSRTMKRAKA